jgi:hypothetical protein
VNNPATTRRKRLGASDNDKEKTSQPAKIYRQNPTRISAFDPAYIPALHSDR